MAGSPPEMKARAEARITLGELLMNKGLLSLEQCLEALRDQKRNGGALGTALVRLGFVQDDDILAVLSVAYGIPSIRLDRFEVHPAVIEVLAPETARKHQVLPLSVSRAGRRPSGRLAQPEATAKPPRPGRPPSGPPG
jgi:hypothetical protein